MAVNLWWMAVLPKFDVRNAGNDRLAGNHVANITVWCRPIALEWQPGDIASALRFASRIIIARARKGSDARRALALPCPNETCAHVAQLGGR
jgi:hypothetical protein